MSLLSNSGSFKLHKTDKKTVAKVLSKATATKSTLTKAKTEVKKTEVKKTELKKTELKKTEVKKTEVQRKKGGDDPVPVGEEKELLGVKIVDASATCSGDAKPKEPIAPIKNLFANTTRFSNGPAAYFFDIISPLMEKQFAKEAGEDFKAFGEAPEKPAPEDQKEEDKTEQVKVEGKISVTDIENSFAAYNWKPQFMTPEDYIYTYTTEANTDAFTFREFVYFDIEFTSKRV